LGRSRGGFGSKFHILVEGNGTPLDVEVTAGQVHDSTRLEPVLTKVTVHQKQGRPKSRPKQLAGVADPSALLQPSDVLLDDAPPPVSLLVECHVGIVASLLVPPRRPSA